MDKTDSILLDSTFLNCKPSTFVNIFSLKSLHIDSEMRLLEAYIKYVEVNKNLDSENASKALKNIRFLNIEANKLVRTNFFTAEQLVLIIRIANNQESEEKTPLGLSTNRLNRCTKVSIKN